MGLLPQVEQNVGKFTLPEDHLFGMRVPKGGSSCSKCKFVSEDGTQCGNTYFQSWRKSLGVHPSLLPAPADEYCCDVFEAAETKEEADKRLQQVEFFKSKGASDLVVRVLFRYLNSRG